MKILCTDLEGTLAPEIWKELGEHLKIPELSLTTRNIPNFEDLMEQRMEALKKNEINFSQIKKFLASVEPFDGAKNFLSGLKNKYQVVIVSDTFYELGLPVVEKLGNYPILCHHLEIEDNYISGYKKRQSNPKKSVVQGFSKMNFECFCIGDSYNDIQMIDEAKGAFIFAPDEIKKSRPDIISFDNYKDLQNHLLK